MLYAITREVSRSLARCELTHLAREPIDVALARKQHGAYEEALRACGCVVERLAEEPVLADSVFVEDTALVLDEVAVILRPGAASRRAETEGVARTLAKHRELIRLEGPGTLDGGDVLRVGRTLWVGLSSRSTREGVEELRRRLSPLGYRVLEAAVSDCLHLKSAVTEVAERTLLLNPAWVDASLFSEFAILAVDPGEPYAANGLRVADSLIYPTSFPATAGRLAATGIEIFEVDLSELAKAEGAVTCCSLVFRT